MEKNKLLYNLVELLSLTQPEDWKEIPLSIKPTQKDFVLIRGDFTYRIKQRNIMAENNHYLNGDSPNTPYSIEVEENGNTLNPIASFNDEKDVKTSDGEIYNQRPIEGLFLYIENGKREWEKGAFSRLEQEVENSEMPGIKQTEDLSRDYNDYTNPSSHMKNGLNVIIVTAPAYDDPRLAYYSDD